MEKSICLFGDSTAWGAWDMEKGGWATRLWLHIAEKSNGNYEFYNLSISGGRTDTILSRFEAEAKAREADTLIFQTGGNDSYLTSKGGPNRVAPDEYQHNLKEIIKRAKQITKEIIFIGFKNVDESRTTPISWKNIYYLNNEIQKYNQIMKDVCQQEGVLFLDIYRLLANSDLEDGLHPNASGHEKIYQKVKEFLTANKII